MIGMTSASLFLGNVFLGILAMVVDRFVWDFCVMNGDFLHLFDSGSVICIILP